MSNEYRLVYSGELLDGQHTAVMKKRLAAVLKLDDERMTVLFSGKSVVVKKSTDKKRPPDIKLHFRKRWLDYGYCPSMMIPHRRQWPMLPLNRAAPTNQPLRGYKLCQGSLVIAPNERREVAPVKVETDHLKIQGAVFTTDDAKLPVDVPNVDHITVAELGVILGEEDTDEVMGAEIDANFDLADPGELMDAAPKEESPPPPDTSHIKLDDKEDDETI